MRTLLNGLYKATRPIQLYSGSISAPNVIPNAMIAVGGVFVYSGVHNATWYEIASQAGKKFIINVDSIAASTYVPYSAKPAAAHSAEGEATYDASGATKRVKPTGDGTYDSPFDYHEPAPYGREAKAFDQADDFNQDNVNRYDPYWQYVPNKGTIMQQIFDFFDAGSGTPVSLKPIEIKPIEKQKSMHYIPLVLIGATFIGIVGYAWYKHKHKK